MVFCVAKLLELIGVVDAGYALFVGLTEENAMGAELRLLALGALLFSLGRLLERKSV